jgi:outer membrane protein assembly factor BamD (BamD/ComL family)
MGWLGRGAGLGLLLLAAGGAAGAGAQAVTLEKAIALTAAPIYLSPDTTSTKVGQVRPGMMLGIQRQARDFVQIFSGQLGVSGWIENRGYVRLDNAQAPEVLFGAGAEQEALAESRSNEDQAANDAAQLFLSIYNYFPASARAAEALYRGADIVWELKMSEEPHRSDPSQRQFPSTEGLRRVISKFPKSEWAQRAAFSLIVTHFTCGSWFDKPDCIGKEIHQYDDYVKKYPRSPRAAQAAYDAIYRAGIAWTIYRQNTKVGNQEKADQYQAEVAARAAAMERDYPGTDWTARAALEAFTVAQGEPMALPQRTPLGGP